MHQAALSDDSVTNVELYKKGATYVPEYRSEKVKAIMDLENNEWATYQSRWHGYLLSYLSR
eukprot:11492687-Ditylum_brightwellii.AAC.1